MSGSTAENVNTSNRKKGSQVSNRGLFDSRVGENILLPIGRGFADETAIPAREGLIASPTDVIFDAHIPIVAINEIMRMVGAGLLDGTEWAE